MTYSSRPACLLYGWGESCFAAVVVVVVVVLLVWTETGSSALVLSTVGLDWKVVQTGIYLNEPSLRFQFIH